MRSRELQLVSRPPVLGAKIAVLVLGAPRSGTSALSQLLSGLGIYFGEPGEFVDPAVQRHNPIFFELQSLNDINDALLASIDVNFGDFDYLPAGDALPLPKMAANAASADVEKLIARQLETRVAIGLKDPRFVYTLPFWEVELRRLGYEPRYVLATRGRDAVIESNRKVNGLGRDHNLRLTWLSSALSALRLAGKDYVTVDFDRLLSDPAGTAAMLHRWLGLAGDPPADAVRSIAVNLRHEDSGGAGWIEGRGGVEKVALEYLDFRRELEVRGFLDLIERRRTEAHGFARALAAAQAHRSEDLGAAMRAVSSLKGVVEDLTAGLTREREVSLEAVDVLKARFDAESLSARELYERRVADLESAIFERDAQIAKLEHSKTELERAAGRVEDQLKHLESALVDREKQLAEQVLVQEDLERANAAVERQLQELKLVSLARDVQLEEARAVIGERDDSIRILEGERQRLSGAIAKLHADGDLMQSTALESRAAYHRLQSAMAELAADRQMIAGALARERRPWYRKLFDTLGLNQES